MPLYHECYDCGKAFPAGWRARDNHCNATGHRSPKFECASCPRWFNSANAVHQHMRDTNHFPYDCSQCPASWPNEQSRKNHEVQDHHYCSECDRTFMNLNNIRMHLNSNIHRGSTIACPFCQNNFATATGVTHHLEGGGCPNARGLSRDQLYKFVRSKDPEGVISKKLLGWTGSVTYEATDRAWNGQAWECYFCHRNFTSFHGLNQHLNSPTHQQALYHCPNRMCRLEFKSLGGIINHLESESCGYTRFEDVQRGIGNVISGDRRITF